jgi:hypothetical protein
MIYEFHKHNLGVKKAVCIFCGKQVGWSDHLYLCKEHAMKYYKIPKVLRILLPKFVAYFFVKEK